MILEQVRTAAFPRTGRPHRPGAVVDVKFPLSREPAHRRERVHRGTRQHLGLLIESDRADQVHRLAEGTVKRLTGGDRLKARRMREDFWSFDPSHTLVMLTNHKPIVGGADEGIWRRLRLVPF